MLIEPRAADHPDVIELTAAAVAELAHRYPDAAGTPYPVYPGARFLVALVNGVATGCGAVQPLDAGLAEIKRMYVVPAHRGRGVARRLLAELESLARGHRWHTLRLETGVRQPEALALYDSAGYRRIDRYGHYADDPYSVCFEKVVSPGACVPTVTGLRAARDCATMTDHG